MRLIFLFAWFLIGIGCSDSTIETAAVGTVSCTNPPAGLICSDKACTQCQPMLAGMCNSLNDCPPPYNACSTNNLCTITPTSEPSKRILFATDRIRPGITAQNSNSQDYIYNIMAKGYDIINIILRSEE